MFRSVVAIISAVLLVGAWAAPCSAEPLTASGAEVSQGRLKLMALELTAFGDFRYRFAKGGADRFEIGSVELGSALSLSPHVMVAAALAYDPEADGFGLGAFTVDGSLFGPEDKHLVKTELIDDSGVIFGKFDVPFGIAYLEYPATDNRFVMLPDSVVATHGGWNDIGVQAYATTSHFEATLYLVNGKPLEDEAAVEAGETVTHAFGGRLGMKPVAGLSLGGSLAQAAGSLALPLYGADLSLGAGPFALKNEYIRRATPGADDVHGFYSEGLARARFLFAGARYETTLRGPMVTERGLALTLGAEIFPQAEVRLAHLRTFDSGEETSFIQLVGGSIWQPTGLRR
jgi:hypothetical protein